MASVDADSLLAGDEAAAATLRTSLRTHGAALVRLGSRDAARLARLLTLSLPFFQRSPHKASASRDVCIPSVGPAVVRLGWRAPSHAKELLRCFRGHPLPLRRAEDAPLLAAARLCEASYHALLTRCTCAALGPSVTERRLRRLHGHNCAFDVFYYRPETAGSAVACDPHIDRGMLHMIFAPVQGLQLWDGHADGGAGLWRAPGELWPSYEPWGHVVMLVNAELEAISTSLASTVAPSDGPESSLGGRGAAEGSPEEQGVRLKKKRRSSAELPRQSDRAESGGRYRACVHRVVIGATEPRVSVSYEIRSAFAVDVVKELGQDASRR